jgi:hypothetical protein
MIAGMGWPTGRHHDGDADPGRDGPTPGSVGGDLRLTRDERRALLDELAAVFTTDAAADRLLSPLGYPRSRRFSIDHATPVLAWEQTLRELANGAVEAPYARLLAAALDLYPHNRTLLRLARDHGLRPAQPGARQRRADEGAEAHADPRGAIPVPVRAVEGSDFFVSYTAVDEAWAEWVASVLEQEGKTVRLQAWDARVGDDYVLWISRQLSSARTTITLYSPAYFESFWCTREWISALALHTLAPLRVVECEPPAILRTIPYSDLFGTTERVARRRLLAASGLAARERTAARGFPGGAPAQASSAGGARRADPADPAGSPAFPGRRAQILEIPHRHRWFTGRDDVLSRLREQFRAGPPDRVRSQVLCGIGGGGKTQLAVEYAHRYAGDYDLVWWVPAEQESTVVDALGGLAGALGLPTDPVDPFGGLAGALGLPTDDREPPLRARRALHMLRDAERWLLVYDDVADASSLDRWLPDGPGHVLVTGRSRSLNELGPLTEVAVFTRDESRRMLRARADHLSEADAGRVAAALGDLPLAVEQAAAYLATTRSTADSYLALLEHAFGRAFLLAPSDYPPGLAGSVDASLARLDEQSPAAGRLLRAAAFLAAEPVPAGVLAGVVDPHADPLVVVPPVLYAIDLFALGRVEADALELHPLTQAHLRERVTGAERERLLADLGDVFGRLDLGEPADPACWPAFAAHAEHLTALFGHLAGGGSGALRRRLLAVARYLERSGQYPSALALSGRALRAWGGGGSSETDAGEDAATAADALEAAHVQAGVLRAAGRAGEAADLDAGTWERRRRLLGDAHRDTLASANALALDLRETGDRHGARTLRESTFEQAREALGADDPLTVDVACDLAFDLYGLGRVEQARAIDEDSVARLRRLLGPAHPRTIAAAARLARDLRVLGSRGPQGRGPGGRERDPDAGATAVLERARALDQDAFEGFRRMLGPDHPDTLAVAVSLAADLYALDDYEAARERNADTARRCRRVLGEEHPLTLRVVNDLGVDMYRLGDARGAERLHRDVFERSRRLRGPDHADTLHAAHNLARDLAGLGELDEAAGLLRDTLERRSRVLGAAHPDTARSARKLGEVDEARRA